MSNFADLIGEIRKRARENMDQGAVTDSYKGDKQLVVKLLNDALATEIVCVLRYKSHYHLAKGIQSQSVAEEFLEHAGQEEEHVEFLADRISQLGGRPNYSPYGLEERAHTEYIEGDTLKEMLREDLVAERIAIGIY